MAPERIRIRRAAEILGETVRTVQALAVITPHTRRRDPIRIEEPPRSPRPRRRKGRGTWRD